MDDFESFVSSVTSDLSSEIGHILEPHRPLADVYASLLERQSPPHLVDNKEGGRVEAHLKTPVPYVPLAIPSVVPSAASHSFNGVHANNNITKDTTVSMTRKGKLDRLEDIVLSLSTHLRSIEDRIPSKNNSDSVAQSVSDKLTKANTELQALRLMVKPEPDLEGELDVETPVKHETGSKLSLAAAHVPLDLRYWVSSEIKRSLASFESNKLADSLELFGAQLESRILKSVNDLIESKLAESRESRAFEPRESRGSRAFEPRESRTLNSLKESTRDNMKQSFKPKAVKKPDTIKENTIKKPDTVQKIELNKSDTDVELLLKQLQRKLDQKTKLVHDLGHELNGDFG